MAIVNKPGPREATVSRLRAKPESIAAVATPREARRETNGITSRLVLLYVEQAGGEDAVQREPRHGAARRRHAPRGHQLFGPDGGATLRRARLPVQPRHAGVRARALRARPGARRAPSLRLQRRPGVHLRPSLGERRERIA